MVVKSERLRVVANVSKLVNEEKKRFNDSKTRVEKKTKRKTNKLSAIRSIFDAFIANTKKKVL